MIMSAVRTMYCVRVMLLLAGCLATVSACSDGGAPSSDVSSDDADGIPTPDEGDPSDDGGPPPDDGTGETVVQGVYTGEITSTATGETRRLVAFADGWGDWRFVTRQGQYHGLLGFDWPLTGITAAGHTWPDGSAKTAYFSFEITERSASDLQGTYHGPPDRGTWLLSAEPKRTGYPDPGFYLLRDESRNHTATFEIGAGGVINGSDMDGCVFSGKLNQDGWTFEYIYEVNLTVENCPAGTEGTSNGDYHGSGGFTPSWTDPHADPVLTLAADNGAQALLLDLEML